MENAFSLEQSEFMPLCRIVYLGALKRLNESSVSLLFSKSEKVEKGMCQIKLLSLLPRGPIFIHDEFMQIAHERVHTYT